MISQQLVKEFLEYKDGCLYWKKNKGSRAKVGKKAGFLSLNGYVQIRLNKKLYYAHRLIYLYHYDVYPKYIDHKDGNPLNNDIKNLRPATNTQNNQNKTIPKSNKSKFKNVSWDKINQKWVVRMKVDKTCKNFGRYNDIDYAIFIADAMRHKFHGEFARK